MTDTHHPRAVRELAVHLVDKPRSRGQVDFADHDSEPVSEDVPRDHVGGMFDIGDHDFVAFSPVQAPSDDGDSFGSAVCERDFVGTGAEDAPQLCPQVGLDLGHVGRDPGVGRPLVLEGQAFLDLVDDCSGGRTDPTCLEIQAAGRGGDLVAGTGHPGFLGVRGTG